MIWASSLALEAYSLTPVKNIRTDSRRATSSRFLVGEGPFARVRKEAPAPVGQVAAQRVALASSSSRRGLHDASSAAAALPQATRAARRAGPGRRRGAFRGRVSGARRRVPSRPRRLAGAETPQISATTTLTSVWTSAPSSPSARSRSSRNSSGGCGRCGPGSRGSVALLHGGKNCSRCTASWENDLAAIVAEPPLLPRLEIHLGVRGALRQPPDPVADIIEATRLVDEEPPVARSPRGVETEQGYQACEATSAKRRGKAPATVSGLRLRR
jgi:hypothetical protein